MKVVLKITVLDRILKDMDDARRQNRAVDYIIVSDSEYDELRSDCRTRFGTSSVCMAMPRTPAAADEQVLCDIREFPLVGRPPTSGCRFRAYPRETLDGVKLYVVPEMYCPR